MLWSCQHNSFWYLRWTAVSTKQMCAEKFCTQSVGKLYKLLDYEALWLWYYDHISLRAWMIFTVWTAAGTFPKKDNHTIYKAALNLLQITKKSTTGEMNIWVADDLFWHLHILHSLYTSACPASSFRAKLVRKACLKNVRIVEKNNFQKKKHDLGKKHFEFQVLKETKFTWEFLSWVLPW